MNKNILYLCVAILFLSLSARFVFSDPATSTSCGDVTGSLTITANILVTGSCFNISASHLVLNGAGYTVKGNGSGIAVNITGFHNVTVRDFAGLNNFSRGVYVENSNNITFSNNTFQQVNKTGLSDVIFIYGTNAHRLNLTLNNITHFGNSVYGTHILSSNATTIHSNTFLGNGELSEALLLQSDNYAVIEGNTITTLNRSKGIYLHTIESTNVSFNVITSKYAGASQPILVFSSTNIRLISNNVTTPEPHKQDDLNYGFYIWSTNGSLLQSNRVNMYGANQSAVVLLSSPFNNLSSNEFHTNSTEENSHGIIIAGTSKENILFNNNISTQSSGGKEIDDRVGANGLFNYLIYNNSFGEIRWTNTSTGGFLDNLTIKGPIGPEKNLNIGQNVAALNTAAFSNTQISSNANITLYGSSLSAVNYIYKASGYYTTSSDVTTNGADCMGGTCILISYSGGTVKFTTTSFSSFAPTDTLPPVPELSDYALLLALTLSLGGFMVLQKKRK